MYLKHAQAGSDANIGDRSFLADEEILVSEESFEEPEDFLDLLFLFGIVFLSVEELGIEVFSNGLIESSDVEVQVPAEKKVLLILKKDSFEAVSPMKGNYFWECFVSHQKVRTCRPRLSFEGRWGREHVPARIC